MIQQIGTASGVSEVPVFYVPAPSQPVNAAAAFLNAFMGTRNPWATELFYRRLTAMDPNERAKALLRARQLENEAEQTRANERNVSLQAGNSLAEALLRSLDNSADNQTTADIEGAKIESAQFLAQTALPEDPNQKALVVEIQNQMTAATAAMNKGDVAAADEALNAANAKMTQVLASTANNPQKAAIYNAVSQASRGLQTTSAIQQEVLSRLGVPDLAPPTPPRTPGAGRVDIGGFVEQMDALGIPLGGGGSVRVGERTTGPVPEAAPVPDGAAPRLQPVPGRFRGTPGSQAEEDFYLAPQTPTSAPAAEPAPATARAVGDGLSEFARYVDGLFADPDAGLGKVGDPIFRRERRGDRRSREATEEFIRQAAPGASSDLRLALQGVPPGPTAGRQIRKDRAAIAGEYADLVRANVAQAGTQVGLLPGESESPTPPPPTPPPPTGPATKPTLRERMASLVPRKEPTREAVRALPVAEREAMSATSTRAAAKEAGFRGSDAREVARVGRLAAVSAAERAAEEKRLADRAALEGEVMGELFVEPVRESQARQNADAEALRLMAEERARKKADADVYAR
jgi:hypothetical protein